ERPLRCRPPASQSASTGLDPPAKHPPTWSPLSCTVNCDRLTRPMSRDAIDSYLFIMDAAFVGDPYQQQSVLNNLKSVRDDDWFWLADGAKRTIFDIVEHVGANKYIYENNAFGDGSMKWDNPGPLPLIDRTTPPNEIIDWMRDGHRR